MAIQENVPELLRILCILSAYNRRYDWFVCSGRIEKSFFPMYSIGNAFARKLTRRWTPGKGSLSTPGLDNIHARIYGVFCESTTRSPCAEIFQQMVKGAAEETLGLTMVPPQDSQQ